MRLTAVYQSHTSTALRKHSTHSHMALQQDQSEPAGAKRDGSHLVRIWELMIRSWGSFEAQRFQGNT